MKWQNILKPCFCSDGKIDTTEIVPQETGLDRVKKMFKKTEFGFLSPEMHYLINSASTAAIVFAIVGGLTYGHRTKENYMRKNVDTQFESQHLARRRLVDSMTLSAFKGGFKYSLKYGSFSGLYLLSTMTVANYNNKITIWEHIGSAALIGGLFRINYGLKGMAAAASAGAVLGALGGGILVFSMWLTNSTFQDLRTLQTVTYYDSRKRQFESGHDASIKR